MQCSAWLHVDRASAIAPQPTKPSFLRLQVTELECRLSASSSQLCSALDANSQHLERYREAKTEAAGLAQQLEQVHDADALQHSMRCQHGISALSAQCCATALKSSVYLHVH